MKALDTKVLVRLLVNDDKAQGRRVRSLLEAAEESAECYLVSSVVLLELMWVLGGVYTFSRSELLGAIEMLMQMPVLRFEDHDVVAETIRLGRAGRSDLPDLLIGCVAQSAGCESTLTFDKRLGPTELFERLS